MTHPWLVRIGSEYWPAFMREHLVFQLLRKRAPFEVLQVATLSRSRTSRIGFRNIGKLCTLLQLRVYGIRFRLGLSHELVARGFRRSGLGRRSLSGNQNFAQPHLFGPLHLGFVLVVEVLDFLLGDTEVRADFLLNHLLRQDAVFHVLLKFFEGHSLRLCRLLQVFHRLRVHLLTEIVESLNDVGIGADA